jgi:hypothetical protein
MMVVVDYYDMINLYEVEVVEFENYDDDNIVEIDLNMMMRLDHNNYDHHHHLIFVMMIIHADNFHHYVHASIDYPLNV